MVQGLPHMQFNAVAFADPRGPRSQAMITPAVLHLEKFRRGAESELKPFLGGGRRGGGAINLLAWSLYCGVSSLLRFHGREPL
jgi:hypothetical protein